MTLSYLWCDILFYHYCLYKKVDADADASFLLKKEADAAIQEGKEGEVCFSIQSYIFTE